MYGWSEIAHAYEMKCLCEVDVTAAAAALLIYIERGLYADLTRRHIDILIGIPITEDNAAQQLRLAYQNISLRQSI
jgi:hypothetical protein